jgi:hypothetical protein
MAGVQLTAPGANPFTTGSDGLFVLTFPQGHPGQDVAVRVSRAGWDVVNDVLLDRQLPEPASAHQFGVAGHDVIYWSDVTRGGLICARL